MKVRSQIYFDWSVENTIAARPIVITQQKRNNLLRVDESVDQCFVARIVRRCQQNCSAF